MNRPRFPVKLSSSRVPRASGDEPVAVQPNMSQSLKLGGRHRETVTSHSVRTAGYVHRPDLTGGSRYRLIEGSLETSPDDLADMGRLRPGRWEGGGEG